MKNTLLGFCSLCPDGVRPGRIFVVASLRKNVHGDYVVDRLASDLTDEIGPSGFAFWPQNPKHPTDLSGCLVSFQCINNREHGDWKTNRDWIQVNKGQKGWEVERIGFRIVDQGKGIQWRQEPRWAKNLPEGERIVIRDQLTGKIVGPWVVGGNLASVPEAREIRPLHAKVYQYNLSSLDESSKYSNNWPTHNLPQIEQLLFPPKEATGQLIDLANGKQLAKWIVDKMIAVAPQTFARFEKETPGWRTKLREDIEKLSEQECKISRDRWKRVEGSLDELIFDAESADNLIKHPKFLERFEELVQTQVEAKVASLTSEIESQAQQKAKCKVEQIEKDVVEVGKQLEEILERREEVSRNLQYQKDTLDERERAVNELVCHLTDSRERLIRDIAIYQSLLPKTNPNPWEIHVEPKPSAKVLFSKPTGPQITDANFYIDSRLWPSLDRWYRGIPRAMAAMFHAAVCGSKAVIIPTPAWARAYADSLGPRVKLTTVNVQPTWLGFNDLWSGGFGLSWDRAVQDSSVVEFVLLRDFNRALPQCYARPLLDMIAGYTVDLPEPWSGCWPKNLRLMACPSQPDESLPLTAEVIRHFAAVQRTSPPEINKLATPTVEGYVSAETWLNWGWQIQPPDSEEQIPNDFGPLGCTAVVEIAKISEVLKTLGMNDREAKRTAREIRLTEPTEYLFQSPSEFGVVR